MTGERSEIPEGDERSRPPEHSDRTADREDDAIDAVESGKLPFELLDDLRESSEDEEGDERNGDAAWGWSPESGEDDRDAAESSRLRVEQLRRLAARLPGIAAIGAIGAAAVAVAAGAPALAVAGTAWTVYGGFKNAGEAVEDVFDGIETLRRAAGSARSLTRRLLARRRGP